MIEKELGNFLSSMYTYCYFIPGNRCIINNQPHLARCNKVPMGMSILLFMCETTFSVKNTQCMYIFL
jgi:hypothetical protein